MRKAAIILLLASATLAGCAKNNPLSPTSTAPQPAVQPFVLRGVTDSRLPQPMLEVRGATAADWAGLRLAAADVDDGNAPRIAADPASYWNRLAGELASDAKLPILASARVYALTHVAILDAMVASRDPRRGELPTNTVVAGAASVVLTQLFPGAAVRIQTAASTQGDLVRSHGEGARARAWALGRRVGRIAVEYARHDGSEVTDNAAVPATARAWAGTHPVLPQGGAWKCWYLVVGDEFRAEAPYAVGSAQDLRDVREVVEAALHRTPDQTAIVHRWGDQPLPEIWNRVLSARVTSHRLDPMASARAYAYLNTAIYDGAVASWKTQYTYWAARPSQRVPSLTTAVPSLNTPAYTSPHATASAGAAAVLTELFPGEQRVFDAQAHQAAQSRIWGGLQFRHDTDQGFAIGQRIGLKVVARMRRDDGQSLIVIR